jgi:hypothetical protein
MRPICLPKHLIRYIRSVPLWTDVVSIEQCHISSPPVDIIFSVIEGCNICEISPIDFEVSHVRLKKFAELCTIVLTIKIP